MVNVSSHKYKSPGIGDHQFILFCSRRWQVARRFAPGTDKFLRDEMANMVWGVENIVPSQAGKGVNGDEMALDRIAEPVEPSSTTTSSGEARISLCSRNDRTGQLDTDFIPAQIKAGSPEIRLQRAKTSRCKTSAGSNIERKESAILC